MRPRSQFAPRPRRRHPLTCKGWREGRAEPAELRPARAVSRRLAVAVAIAVFAAAAPRAALASPSDGSSRATAPSEPPAAAPAAAADLGRDPAPSDVPRISLGDSIRFTLQRNPTIRVQAAQVMINRGLAQQTDGAFDFTLGAEVQGSYGKADRQETLSYTAGVSKLLQLGVTVGPLVEATQQLSGEVAYTKTIAGLAMSIPLLQGLGTEVVTAPQRAAYANLAAQEYQLRFVAGNQLLAVIQSYWTVKAAEEQLAIDVEVEKRYRELVSMTEDLVKGSIQPAAQITQARASLEQSIAGRISAEQSLTNAAQNLAVLIGLPNDQVAAAPRAAEALPTPQKVAELDRATLQRLVSLALERRDDLHAVDKQLESSRILLVAAENQLLPKLQLQIAGGLGGLTEGGRTARELIPGETGMNGLAAQGSLTFSFPVENNAAKGALVAQQGAVAQNTDSRALVASQISTGVIDAAQGLARAYEELVKLDQSYQLFKQSVDDQRELFKLGMASIVDVTTTEQSLASAQSQRLSGALNYANAIAQLRYATGTLLPLPDAAPASDSPPAAGAEAVIEAAARAPAERLVDHGL